MVKTALFFYSEKGIYKSEPSAILYVIVKGRKLVVLNLTSDES